MFELCQITYFLRMKQFIKDLPIYINAFVVTMLAMSVTKPGLAEFFLWLLSGVTFIWYGHNVRKETAEKIHQENSKQQHGKF